MDLLVKVIAVTIFFLMIIIAVAIIGAVVNLLLCLWKKIFPDKEENEVEKVYVYVPIPKSEYEFTDLQYEFEHWNDNL